MLSAAAVPDKTPIKEIIGIYENDQELNIAIGDLIDAGFNSVQIGLVARKEAVRERLSEVYRDVMTSPATPSHLVEFVGRQASSSIISHNLGSLGSLSKTAGNGDVVASRSILLSAALKQITGEVMSFPSGVAALSNPAVLAKNEEPEPHKCICEALVDDRLLLMVSEPSKMLNVAKDVLDISDSIDEGIIEIDTRL